MAVDLVEIWVCTRHSSRAPSFSLGHPRTTIKPFRCPVPDSSHPPTPPRPLPPSLLLQMSQDSFALDNRPALSGARLKCVTVVACRRRSHMSHILFPVIQRTPTLFSTSSRKANCPNIATVSVTMATHRSLAKSTSTTASIFRAGYVLVSPSPLPASPTRTCS